MRIAFDLDGTLIRERFRFPLEPLPRNPLRRMACSERLRLGTPELLNQLWSSGHEVLIYTTSFRGIFATRMLFRGYGTRVASVINVSVHQRKIARLDETYKMCSKYPPAFNIDLLIDNCGGVAIEAKRYNFNLLQIHPEDNQWMDRIREHLGIA